MVNNQYSADSLIEKNYQEQLDRVPEQQSASAEQQPVSAEQQPDIPSPITNPTTPPLGGGMRGSQYIRSDVSVLDNPPKPKPFMAVNQTADGRPLYGTGFHGWVRKLWADISDPYKLLQDAQKLSDVESDAIWASYNQNVEASGQIIEDKLRWSKWGEKIFGIDAEEVAALTAGGKAERDIADATGESQLGTAISRTVAIARDTTQNVIWGGLDILSLDDTLLRKIYSTVQGIDSIADRYNKDEPSNFLEELGQIGIPSITSDLFTIHQNVRAGNTTWNEVGEVTKKYREGSYMAYTMIFDQYRRNEFDRRVLEGADPRVVAEELGILSTEITGSILGSPSTYLGLNIRAPINIFAKSGNALAEPLIFFGRNVELFGYAQKVPWRTIARIPTFGEIVGLSVGKTRFLNEAKRFTEQSSTLEGLETIVKNILNTTGETQAIKILENASNYFATKLDDMAKHKKWWNLASLDSQGRVAVTTRDSSMWIQSLVGREGIDTSLQIMRDLVIVKRGGSQSVEAASRLLARNNSNLLTSDVALMTAEIVNRLDSSNIFNAITRLGNKPIELHDEIFKQLNTALSDFIPSVDEMWDASKAIKDKNIPVDSRTLDLAKQWELLPSVVKTVRTVTKIPENIAKKTTAVMTYAFMNLVPRAWTRGIAGQFWGVATQQGLKNALETTATSVLGLNKKATTTLLDSNMELMAKRLGGYVPSTSARNIRNFTNTKAFGVLPAIGRSEDIAASQVMVSAVNDTIQKSLPVVVKNLPEYDNFINALPKEQQPLFFSALKRTFGNWDDATALFRKQVGNGEIEAWRLTEPSEKMRKELERLGMLEIFYEVQQTAKSMDEFTKFVDDFIDTYKTNVTKLAENLPATSSLPSELLEWGKDLNKLPDKMSNVIRELYQGWDNTLTKLGDNTQAVLKQAEEMAFNSGDKQLFDNLQLLKQEINTLQGVPKTVYAEIDAVRSQVAPLIKSVYKMSPQEIAEVFTNFKVIYKGRDVFSLAKIYPNLNPATLDPKKAVSLLWEAMFENTASAYKNTNLGSYNKVMDKLEEVAGLFGSSLDEIAGSGTAFRELDDLRRMTLKIEDAFSWQRLFRSVNFKPDLDPEAPLSSIVDEFKKLHPDWDGNPAYLAGNQLGEPAQGNSVASLANRFGIASIGTKTVTNVAGQAEKVLGAKKDRMLLNIINEFIKTSVGDVKDVKKYENGQNALKAIVEGDSTIESLQLQDIAKGYNKIDDVPLDIAEQAFRKYTGIKESITAIPVDADKTKPYFDKAGNLIEPTDLNNMTVSQGIEYFNKTRRVPPYNPDTLPDELRSMWEGLPKFTQDIRDWGDTVVQDWGVKVKTLPVNVEGLIKEAKKAYKTRFDVVQATAGVVAESTRNFAFHDYQRAYLDHALTLLLGNSFHYWTTRTYARALETLVENPKYANIYMQYKEWNEKQHSDLPDWYRQNLRIDSLFGIDLNNPYYVNLESMINPMYGLTGTDFNDPNKRVDWLSRTIDDMGKMGPGFSPLVQWAVAMHLYNKGEEDASNRWTNRLLPQSQIIKSGSAWLLGKLGIQGAVEVDPFVNFLEGGVDPYERNRVSVALAMMVRNGQITQEQMIEASRITNTLPENGEPSEAWLQANEIWAQAVQMSAENRFAGDFTSFFFGAGARPRTQEDMVVEKFWNDYGALISSRDMMTSEQYRQQWDKLREHPEYGSFVDALLISRKTGDEQDTAYAYNVLGRIPPGQMSDVAKAVGINPDMLQSFYDNKGQLDEMGLTPQDQKRFMAGVADIGAILAMPDNPTRAEWTSARIEYSNMNEEMSRLFGEEISKQIDMYYDADNKADYLDDFPEVQQALDWQTRYINQNKLLARYYGGIDSIQQYYRNATENILIKEFGVDQMELFEEYSSPKINPDRKKELAKTLKLFIKRRNQLRDENLQAMTDIALLLPDPPQSEAQEGVTPQGVSQNELFQLTQPAMTPEQWQGIVGESNMQLIMDFVYNGEDIPYVVMNNLDYLAEQQGLNGDDMLLQIIQSFPQVTQ